MNKKWSDDDERRVALALGAARDVLVGMGRSPLGPDIVFTALERSVDIERRLQVKGGPARVKSLWSDYIHSYDERLESEKQRNIDISYSGSIKLQVTPAEVSTMEAINCVFRACLVGNDQERRKRDMKVLHQLAEGRRSHRDIGKAFLISHTSVQDVKAKQCGAIWHRLKSLLPEEHCCGDLLRAA